MAFQTSLSGLNAAQANLSVTGNNIANSSTNGFKKSRAEFADIFASSFAGASSTAVGAGVRLTNVAQQFAQGNVEFTDNNLDLAINGDGFFVLKDTDGSSIYTRAGAYGVDREGYVVNSQGQKLQSYAVNEDGEVTNFTGTDLRLSTSANPASATENIELNLNLDASRDRILGTRIDPNDPDTYGFSTSTTIYDSLGEAHTTTLYFQRASASTGLEMGGNLEPGSGPHTLNRTIYDSLGNAYEVELEFTETAADNWTVDINIDTDGDGVYDNITQQATIDFTTTPATIAGNTILSLDLGNPDATPVDFTLDLSTVTQSATPTTVAVVADVSEAPDNMWNTLMTVDGVAQDTEVLSFSSSGQLLNSPTTINFNDDSGLYDPGNGAELLDLTIDFAGSTQYAGESSVNTLVQDGYTTGRMSSIDIDSKGVVFARYTNGQSTTLGAVAVVNFSNPQGLQPIGDTNWAQTFESGDVLPGQAGTGTIGAIQSGALESSNVDLSKQLVNMIVAQRDFQANAKMISTEDAVTQSIINIR